MTNACAFCNFDLRGAPSRGRCPECGKTWDARWWKRSADKDDERRVVLAAVAALFCSILALVSLAFLPACGVLLFVALAAACGARTVILARGRSRIAAIVYVAILALIDVPLVYFALKGYCSERFAQPVVVARLPTVRPRAAPSVAPTDPIA